MAGFADLGGQAPDAAVRFLMFTALCSRRYGRLAMGLIERGRVAQPVAG